VKVKILLGIGGFVAAGVVFTALLLLMSGPHMYYQPNIKAFQAVMPLPPTGAVPLNPAHKPLPTPEEAATLTNPVRLTDDALDRGRIYYQYYCIFCHGAKGTPDTPIARSYVPTPADLHSEKIRAYSEGQLLRAMLLGPGHEPVLERVVPDEARWYLTHYVKRLAHGEPVPLAEWPTTEAAVPRIEQ
jgi:hypothetical protein